MLAKRIIPCLDIKNGRVVKGVHFLNLKDAGDPVELASYYSASGADELVFLDITATLEKRDTILELVQKTAEKVFIPLTVGGGIRKIEDIRLLLKYGADKISINTAAVKNPDLIKESAEKFGSQCIVVAIDVKKKIDFHSQFLQEQVYSCGNRNKNDKWTVFINAGTTPTELDAIEWAEKVEKLGAGEILLTSMNTDGTKIGYDIEITRRIAEVVNIPIIASGGAGNLEHIFQVLSAGKADAALAASIFHYSEYTIADIKQYLKEKGLNIRI